MQESDLKSEMLTQKQQQELIRRLTALDRQKSNAEHAQQLVENTQSKIDAIQAKAEKKADKAQKEREKQERIAEKIKAYEGMGLITNPNTGEPENTVSNYINLIENNKEHFKLLRFDEFSQQVYYGDKILDDNVFVDIVNIFSLLVGWDNHQRIQDAVLYVANQNRFNVLTDYLDSLVWDQTERIRPMFKKYLGADSGDKKMNIIYENWALIWTHHAVKRAYEPGCKFDNILVLTGPQGIGKSNFCEKLAIKPEWYCENVQIGDKDGYQQLRDSWIINMDEITSLNKKDAATAKNFITSTSDKFREAYGRFSKTYQRHCIFIGTTNEEVFLKDTSSLFERRFWVVQTSGTLQDSIDRFKKLDKSTVDQIWAEAVYYYKYESDKFRAYMTPDEEKVYAEFQREYKVDNDSDIFLFLDDALNRNYVDFTDESSLMHQYKMPGSLTGTMHKQDRFSVTAIINLLKDNHFSSFGSLRGVCTNYAKYRSSEWKYSNIRINGRQTRCLVRVTPSQP